MDVKGLRAKGAEIKARIRDLTGERASHALPALDGDKQAAAAIDAIDAERQRLDALLETVEQACQALHRTERERKADPLNGHDVPALQRQLVAAVADRREYAASLIERRSCSPREIAELLASIDPLNIARKLTRGEAAARELVAKTKLPPLPQVLATAAHRHKEHYYR